MVTAFVAFRTRADGALYLDHHLLREGILDVMGERDFVHGNASVHP